MTKSTTVRFTKDMLLAAEFERTELLGLAKRFRLGNEQEGDREELLKSAEQVSALMIGLQREHGLRA
jgi:hypothetical protein